jgi:RimJ/RimL family protein N-acetyltransferase
MDRPLAKGKKTRLRPLVREDVDAMLRWGRHADPLLAGYNMPRLDRPGADEWYRARTNRPDFRIFAIQNRDGAVLGRLSIREIDNRLRRARLGIVLDPSLVDQGLGTDALTAFQEFYFEHLRFETLVLDVAAYNVRARRCYENCGFHYTGRHWQREEGLGEGVGFAVFTDSRFAEVRRFFRQTRAGLEVLYCDMEVTREEYRARAAARQ